MKNVISRALNLALYLSTCLLIGSGLLLDFRLLPGSQGGRGLSLYGLNRHEWGDIHAWIAYVFIVLIAVHLALHWKWLVKIASQNRSYRLWAGLLIGLATILFFLLSPVNKTAGRQHGHGQNDHPEESEHK